MLKKTTTLFGWEAVVALLLTILLLVLINISCENDATGPAADQSAMIPNAAISAPSHDVSDRWGKFRAELISYSACTSAPSEAIRDEITSSQAVEWTYDGLGTLDLTHINAAFYCCSEVRAHIWVRSNVITIEEDQVILFLCPCLGCLRDVDYRITGLPPGKYLIIVDGVYSAPFEFEATLTGSGSSGIFVVDR